MELQFTYEDCFDYAVAAQVDLDRARKAAETGTKLRIKLGIDPTSPNIHLGRAVVIWRLRAFQEMGHEIHLIIGDFTGQVGDTSDKESERPMLDTTVIAENMQHYEKQLWMILNPEKRQQVHFHHNSTWLSKLTFAEIGKMADVFSVNQFIKRELITRRLETGSRVSLREMLYPLMQGSDSVEMKADVELGGTDQWFNLLAGRDLQIQAGQPPQTVIVGPLIHGLDGRKMSSSQGNGIALLDTPAEKFGRLMTLDDQYMEEFLLIFPRSARPFSAEQLRERLMGGENPRDLKLEMAERLVVLYHGEDAGRETRDAYIHQFLEGQMPEDMPEVAIPSAPISLIHFMAEHGLAESVSDARRLIEQGGVRLDGTQVTNEHMELAPNAGTILQVGKRKFIKFV